MKTQEVIVLKKQLLRIAELDQRSPLDLSGAVRLKIAKTLRKCETVEADFEKVRVALVRAKGVLGENGNYSVQQGTPEFKEFAAAVDEVLGAEAEGFQPVAFTEEDLKVEKNRIPIDVLNGLIAVDALKD